MVDKPSFLKLLFISKTLSKPPTNNLLRYNRSFNRKHRINATLGLTYDVRDNQNSVYAVQDFVSLGLTTDQPYLGSVIDTPLTYLYSKQQVFSFLGRLNYSYKNLKGEIVHCEKHDSIQQVLQSDY